MNTMLVQTLKFPNTSVSRTWIVGFIAVLLVGVVFREALIVLVNGWRTHEEYSHGYLVPLVTAWLLWARRDVLIANIGHPNWMGPMLVAIAMLVHLIGELSTILTFSQLAFVIALFGIILAIGGVSLLRASFVAIAFLIFAIPLPDFINASLTLELELISSRLGVEFVRLFDIPVYLEGNLIDLGAYKLQVVEACSGLRYLFPLLSLSFLATYLFQAPIWQRSAVLISSIPISIGINGFRIGAIGVAVDRWGPRVAEGMLHLFEGWIIFVVSTLLLLLEVYLLARFSGKRFSECFGFVAQAAAPTSSTRVQSRDRKPFFTCVVLIIATLFGDSIIGNRVELIPQRHRFITFPATIGDWHGHSSLLEPEVEKSLALDDYIVSDYSNFVGKTINLYVAYYSTQHRGKYHSPLVCIPGDGWSITSFERTKLDADHPINRVVIERNGSRQLVYYWYEERGRRIASEYWSRWYLIHDAITMNRSDGALVRLVTPIMPNESNEDADNRLQLFVRDLGPSLNRFLASADQLAFQ